MKNHSISQGLVSVMSYIISARSNALNGSSKLQIKVADVVHKLSKIQLITCDRAVRYRTVPVGDNGPSDICFASHFILLFLSYLVIYTCTSG